MTMPPGHAVLVSASVRWLRGARHCVVVFSEHVTRSPIVPDAIGWHGEWSILVECKASRSDFFADRQKPIHHDPDGYPGQERWYLTPPGLVKVEELPAGWRLAELHGWTPGAPGRVKLLSPLQRRDTRISVAGRARAELPFLLSAVRRHQLGVPWLEEEAHFESINRQRRREAAAQEKRPVWGG